MYNLCMKNSFNSHANTYDEYTNVQKKVASNLLAKLKIKGKRSRNIYEIGCGTGYLSQALLNTFEPDNLYLNDICPNMLSLTKLKFDGMRKESTTRIHFIEADIEDEAARTLLNNKYDLICSSSVFQWIKTLEQVFIKINNALMQDGLFSFAFFIDKTFTELNTAFCDVYKNLNMEYENPLLDFYKKDYVLRALKKSGFRVENFKTVEHLCYYNSPLEFMKTLKQVGASNFREKNVSYIVLKNVLKKYKELFKTENNKVKVTYKVLYCISRK